MTRCPICHNVGILRVEYAEDRTCDLAACVCVNGQVYRVKYHLKLWAVVHGYPAKTGIRLLEDIYSPQAIAELPQTVEDAPPFAELFTASAFDAPRQTRRPA